MPRVSAASRTRSRAATAAPQRDRRERFSARLKRWGAWWALGGCLLIALLLRVPWLSVPLGRDEAGLTFVAQHWDGLSLYGDYWIDRPPLLILLFKLAALGGTGGVRALGAVTACALVVAITLLARRLAGPGAGMIAGLLAALMTGSSAIHGIYTPGELLAAVPSTLSVLALVHAHSSRRTGAVVAAGALAMIAVLVKQSFLDAGFAGVVFVLASAVADRDVRVRWPLAYAAGAIAPLLVVLVWLGIAGVSLRYFSYTMFEFRLDLLHTLAGSNAPLKDRLLLLEEPAWDAGLVLVLGIALLGLVLGMRRDRVLLVTLAAWLAAAVVGVLGGGSYFAHYLLQLVPVGCVLGAVGLARVPAPVGAAALAVVAYLALSSVAEGFRYLEHTTVHHRERAIGDYIREHAGPDDTIYVMYARPNVVYYAGLRHPYPYLWSLMVRVRPGAVARAPAAARLAAAADVAGALVPPVELGARPRPGDGAHDRPRLPGGRDGLRLRDLRPSRRRRPGRHRPGPLSLAAPLATLRGPASVAQLVEHFTRNEGVSGSSPLGGSPR